jgi:hypothetical protein
MSDMEKEMKGIDSFKPLVGQQDDKGNWLRIT